MLVDVLRLTEWQYALALMGLVLVATRLTTDPGNDVKLQLYGLYKQATSGDVSGKRPGFTDPVGRAKYDAWSKAKGATQDGAKQQYIDTVAGLLG